MEVAGLLPLNIKPLNPCSDLNEVHLTAGQGLTMLYTVNGTINKPEGSSGIYFHVQRMEGTKAVSTSQLIYQFTILLNNLGQSKIFFRFGSGTGTDISWRDWNSVPE